MNKIIAVDFDGTLCENAYPDIGTPKSRVIDYILQERRNGTKLILWTNRCGEYLDAAIVWCAERGIVFDGINENLPEVIQAFGDDPRKIFANLYLDDRALSVDTVELYQWATRNPPDNEDKAS